MRFQRRQRCFWISAFALAACASFGRADGLNPHQDHCYYLRNEGAYYPGPYYSRAYIQDFPLEQGDRPLFFRLRPFEFYGRYRYGEPIEPCLTNGTVESDRFPYRYRWDFTPTEAPPEIPYDPCTDPLARRYDTIDSVLPQAPPPNEPFELPQSRKRHPKSQLSPASVRSR